MTNLVSNKGEISTCRMHSYSHPVAAFLLVIRLLSVVSLVLVQSFVQRFDMGQVSLREGVICRIIPGGDKF